jgi:hypothetical protein
MRQSAADIRMFGILVAAVISAAAISSCRSTSTPHAPGAVSSPWLMSGHDRAHSGRSGFDTSTNPGAQKWRFATGGSVASPAIGADGTIYAGSDDFSLYAVAPDGVRKWSLNTDSAVGSPAIAADGTIYAVAGQNLYSVNPDGKKKWVFAIGDATRSSPTIAADGTIYVSAGQNLYSINPLGTLKWKFTSGQMGAINFSPAIGADGTVYFGSGELYAVGAAVGPLLVATLEALEARGMLRLPAEGGRRWDRSTLPSVPTSIEIVREPLPRSSTHWRRFPWHPSLQWVLDRRRLSPEQVLFLERVQRGLVNGDFLEPAPLKYRSLQLTGHEKRLSHLTRGALFGEGRLTLDLVGCLPETLPLAC